MLGSGPRRVYLFPKRKEYSNDLLSFIFPVILYITVFYDDEMI